MNRPLSALSVLLFVLPCALAAEPSDVKFTVQGFGRAANGEGFAVLQGIGVVRAGDEVPYSSIGETGTLKIKSVHGGTVLFEKQQVRKLDPPVRKARLSGEDDLRDPFRPIAASGDEEP